MLEIVANCSVDNDVFEGPSNKKNLIPIVNFDSNIEKIDCATKIVEKKSEKSSINSVQIGLKSAVKTGHIRQPITSLPVVRLPNQKTEHLSRSGKKVKRLSSNRRKTVKEIKEELEKCTQPIKNFFEEEKNENTDLQSSKSGVRNTIQTQERRNFKVGSSD